MAAGSIPETLAESLRRAAVAVRSVKPAVKIAAQELDPEHVLNFLRFFGGRHVGKK